MNFFFFKYKMWIYWFSHQYQPWEAGNRLFGIGWKKIHIVHPQMMTASKILPTLGKIISKGRSDDKSKWANKTNSMLKNWKSFCIFIGKMHKLVSIYLFSFTELKYNCLKYGLDVFVWCLSSNNLYCKISQFSNLLQIRA